MHEDFNKVFKRASSSIFKNMFIFYILINTLLYERWVFRDNFYLFHLHVFVHEILKINLFMYDMFHWKNTSIYIKKHCKSIGIFSMKSFFFTIISHRSFSPPPSAYPAHTHARTWGVMSCSSVCLSAIFRFHLMTKSIS